MRGFALGVLLSVTLAATLAAPVPKDLQRPGYFPSALGTKWEFAYEGERESVLTVEVTKVTDKDAVRTIVLEQTAGPKVRDYPESYRIDSTGVYLLSAVEKELSPPRLDLRAKPRPNDEWNCPHEWAGINYTCVTTVAETESVTVPAGTFRTIPHTQTYGQNQFTQSWTAWHAPGVGRVKFKDYSAKVYVLLKYTPGADRK